MTERKLSQEEIDELFLFCYKLKIKEYEVQFEIVDHLASSIEKQLASRPEMLFKEAMIKACKSFGINEFHEFVKSKHQTFRKQFNLLFWKFLGTFFRLPRIILTISITIALYTSLHFFDHRKAILLIAAIVLVIFYIAFLIIDYFTDHFRINLKNTERLFLIINYFNQIKLLATRGGSLLYVLLAFFFKPFIASQGVFLDMLGSISIVLLFIFYYTLMFYMPQKLKRHFTEQFPQFVKS